MLRAAVLVALLGVCWCDELSVSVEPASLTIAPPFFPPRGCVCNKKLDPVCGFDHRTYSNSCLARCAGASVKCKGRCPCKAPPTTPPGCHFANGRWFGCGPSPTPSTPSDINQFLDECVKKGELAAVAAARAACSSLLLKCPARGPRLADGLRGAASASFAKSNPADALLEAVLEGACLSEAETACKGRAFGSISNRDCLKVLNSGPAHPQPQCRDVQHANQLFNGQVNSLCRRKRTPIIIG